MAKMSEQTLKSILDAKIQGAIGYQGGRLALERAQADRYYTGDKFGNEQEGRSQVVDRVVAEVVDGMLPSLIKIFSAGDEVVRFEPRRAGQEEMAAQATDYVNYLWSTKNKGFSNFHTWFKSALLKKLGVVKIWWDEEEETKREEYEGITREQLIGLLMDDGVELISHEQVDPEEDGEPDQSEAGEQEQPAQPPQMAQGMSQPGMAPGMAQPPQMPAPPPEPTYNAVIKRTDTKGHICVRPVPPDEFLIDRRTVDEDEVAFIGERRKMNATDLTELFPEKKKLIDTLPGDGMFDFETERLERWKDEDELPFHDNDALDKSMRQIWVTEAYLKVDFDGDGKAELRKVTIAGSGGDAGAELLDNVEVDDHPYCTLCPVPMPHKLIGMSIADQTIDLQLIKSTVLRQMLDSLYLANAPQLGIVDNMVNMDDLLVRKPGGFVRMKQPDAIVPIPTTPIAADAFSMMQYLDQTTARRTGHQQMTPGPGADALNPYVQGTATGASIMQNAQQERLELIARIFAETGVKRAFKRILELVCKYQQKAEVIRLRGEWIPMDPREWDTEMDVSVLVGLGTGDKNAQVAHMTNLLQIDQQIIMLQGGLQGPILTAENVFAKLKKLCEATGLRNTEVYYTDPKNAPPMPPRPDPKAQAAQAQLQIAAQKAQMQQQHDMQSHQMKMQREQQDAQNQASLQQAEMQRQTAHEQMRAQADMAIQQQKAQMEMTIAAMKAQHSAELEAEKLKMQERNGAFKPKSNGSDA